MTDNYKYTARDAADALAAIPTPGEGRRDEWLKIGMAYKAAGGDFETWDAWSRQGGGYDGAAARSTWDSIAPVGGITAGTLFGKAREHGWRRGGDYDRLLDAARRGKPRRDAGGKAKATDKADDPDKSEGLAAQKAPAGGAAVINRFIAECEWHEGEGGQATAYLKGRGLTEETIKRFRCGYAPCFELAGTKEPRVIIPYPGDAYYMARRLSDAGDRDGKKSLYPKKEVAGGKRLFNFPALTGGAEEVIICEGQIDAMTLAQAGAAAVGCNEAAQMLTALDRAGDALTARRFVYCLDMDAAGVEKGEKMRAALAKRALPCYPVEMPEGVKDANDLLTQRGAAALQEWLRGIPDTIRAAKAEEAKDIAAMTAEGRFAGFLDRIGQSKTGLPTGFDALDRELGGGLFPGLYAIGAISSLGKTTFALQMADHLAASGNPVMIFSLEMGADELMAKSISRLTVTGAIGQDPAPVEYLTTRQVLLGARRFSNPSEREAAFQAACKRYQAFAARVAIVEGVAGMDAKAIRAAVDRFITATGTLPVVFVDYLQIIAPADIKATEKQNTDAAVLELKRMARDFRTPVVAISSFNRDNYNTKASLAAFKESGGIEYTTDGLIGLELKGTGDKGFDTDKAKAARPREVVARVLKNRNGASGGAVEFAFDARFNVFRERGTPKPGQERRVV